MVGDEVEVFETESRTIISKKEQKKDAVPEGGIHHNLSNAQNIGAGQVQYAPGKVVKKLVYCLLAFFLGWAGTINFMRGASVPVSFTCCSAGQEFRQLSLLSSLSSACAKRRMQQEILWSKQKKLSRWRAFSLSMKLSILPPAPCAAGRSR